ncbi:hypothetical protein AOA80_04460 [Methanomassiliicoccales archaeon RumEn M1]|nr:hypothetical protein AOA80_04460 [Methanomassiliicoccales archaeon RumEn M1]
MTGFALWLAFLVTGRIGISNLGIVNSLGPLYFLAVSLMVGSIIVSAINKNVTIITYMALIGTWSALYTLPILIDGTGYFTYSYKVLGYTNFIIDRGFYDPIGLPYLNWPGIMLMGTFVTYSTGTDAINLLLIVPILIKLLQLLIVGVITFKLTDESHLAILASLGFILFDWTAYYLFLPPALGLLFLLTIIYLIVRRYKHNDMTRYWGASLALIFFSLAASHLLSSVLCLIIIILMLLGPQILKKSFGPVKGPSPQSSQ